MTRKDYELIAKSIYASSRDVLTFNSGTAETVAVLEAIEHIADNLASALQADNPRFDSVRFLKACGV